MFQSLELCPETDSDTDANAESAQTKSMATESPICKEPFRWNPTTSSCADPRQCCAVQQSGILWDAALPNDCHGFECTEQEIVLSDDDILTDDEDDDEEEETHSEHAVLHED